MYIALYDENRNHITNVDNATYDLTTRVYDNDSFSGEGVCDEDVNDAKIAVVNDDGQLQIRVLCRYRNARIQQTDDQRA